MAQFAEGVYRAEVLGTEEAVDGVLYRLLFVDFGNESRQKKEELYTFDRDEQHEVSCSKCTWETVIILIFWLAFEFFSFLAIMS